jgi:hypothetical protein
MAYNVQALTDYINEQKLPIIRGSIMESKTVDLFKSNIQVGIKHSEALNLMNVDPKLQSDAVGASTDGNSDITFKQRILTVAPIAVREFIDPKVLNTKWMNTQVNAGSKDDTLVFEQELMTEITEKIAVKNEFALWQGNTASGNDDLNKYDGYLKVIDAETGTTVVTAATFTSANALALVDSVYSTIPMNILNQSDTSIFMGWDYFRIYTTALKNANLFHYGVDAMNGEIVVPGTSIKIYALNGLNGSKRIVSGRISNFYIGTDLLDEADTAEAIYLHKEERVKLKVAYKLGVQIALPEELVVLKVA